MGTDKSKDSGNVRRKLTPSQKKRVNDIVMEAGGPSQSDPPLEGDYEERYRQSEEKRRMLAEALQASRDRMRKLMPFPSVEDQDRALPFGVFVRMGEDGKTAIIRHHGRLYEAKIQTPEPERTDPQAQTPTFHAIRDRQKECAPVKRNFIKGELLLLNNELQVVEARGFDLICGSLGSVVQVLDDDKLLIKTVGDETIIVSRAEQISNMKILPGDNVEYDHESLFAYSLMPKGDVEQLVLEKVPDIGYDHIGGLEDAITQIRDAIELPHIYPEYFQEHKLSPPKGILLYGPPGCGKTLIAKAVANSLVRSIEEKTGEKGQSYFLNVKGPELLNKYVGETEQAIRDLFGRARNKATYKTPVIVFFDEMDSMFRVRGSGVSSDMESTIVPQLLAELDGLEALENVVVIGASNREDLIDPAVLRPGRLDRKIRIPRPDRPASEDIFSKYLTPDLPLDPELVEKTGGAEQAVKHMIAAVADEMFSTKPENELMEITYADGTTRILYLKDFSSGAIVENIVNRAKFSAVKELITTGRKGIRVDHLMTALEKEFEENEDLPSKTNPSEWYRIIGKGGERVVRVRSLYGKSKGPEEDDKPGETVEVGEGLS